MTEILIVDNNLVDLELMRESLAEAGFRDPIHAAVDVDEALARLDPAVGGSRPDLVILDLRLTSRSGLDVLAHIRAHATLRAIPVVVHSNAIDGSVREACLAAGATAVSMKPRRFADQVALAREWMDLLPQVVAEVLSAPTSAPSRDDSHASRHQLADIERDDVLELQDRLRPRLRAATSLEDAAAAFVEALTSSFGTSVVLARMFATLPFGGLPEELRRAAWEVVESQALHGSVHDATPVLTLMSTWGREESWCDRRRSRGHAAIPLSSKSFVDSIPMIARMLQDMGLDLGLSTDGDPYVERELAAGWIGLFYVGDALSARDDQGRRIIPAVDFVERYGVRTVFGLGKAYANGSVATLVVFTNAIVPRARVQSLVPIMNLFKAETLGLVNDGRLFGPAQTLGG